jgi:hypothetical protein
MSAFLYGVTTRQREHARSHASKKDKPPGISPWSDLLTALVPAEVIAFHAFAVSLAGTRTVHHAGAHGHQKTATVLKHQHDLKLAFAFCLVMCVVLYLAGHVKTTVSDIRLGDLAISLIPVGAFICWTMIQKPSMFDVVKSDWSTYGRLLLAAGGATLLGVVTVLVGYKKDGQNGPG